MLSHALRRGREALRSRPEAAAGAAALVLLLWVHWPTLHDMAGKWARDAQYSHGYLVPAFSLFLLWWYRGQFPAGGVRPHWGGLPLLVCGLALRLAGTYFYFKPLDALAILPTLAGVLVLLGGWRFLLWSGPALAFLVFMMPLPYRLEVALSHPLQRIGTLASTYALQTLGFPAYSEGNVIRLGQVRIGVVEACSGLSMLMIFFALATAVTLLVRRPWPERLLVLASAVPIALISNITRITVTGVLHHLVGSRLANLVFHDLAGWLMMPLALFLLWAELRLLSWVLIDPPPQHSVSVADLVVPPGPGRTQRPHTSPGAGPRPARPLPITAS